MISIQEISFRHGPGGAALPLLKDGKPLAGPEWSNGHSEPAAYRLSAAQTVVVMAVFTTDENLTEVRIRARRLGDASRYIGDVEPVSVRFNADRTTGPVRCNLQVRNDAGVGIELVEWVWEARIGNEWREFGRTTHEIAIVLDTPQVPWTVESAGGTQPWWEVLLHACAGAKGARSSEEAISALTHVAYDKWGRQFYKWGPSRNYASDKGDEPAIFDCARFLRLLNDEPEPELVDCSDMAVIITTFAAILGCPAVQKAISPLENTRPLLMVGHENIRPSTTFGLHEFGTLESDDAVWDACLRLTPGDESANVSGAFLPVEMPADGYLSHLLEEQGQTMSDLESDPEPRAIGTLDRVSPARAEDVLVRLALDRLSFPPVEARTGPRRHVRRIDLRGVHAGQWELVETSRPSAVRSASGGAEPAARALWTRVGPGRLMVACEVYLCEDAERARLRALTMLGRLLPFGPKTTRALNPASVDAQFEASNGEVIVAVFLNAATQVRAASRDAVPGGTVPSFFEQVQRLIGRAAES